MKASYDVIVIGGGPAGRAAAKIARKKLTKVLIIESYGFGGTCPLRGCIPKKILAAATETMENIRNAKNHCITVKGASLDWKGIIDLKRSLIRPIPAETETGLQNLGIHTIQGRAKFTGPGAVEIDGQIYTAKKIVIATGSKPRKLPISGFEYTLSSDDLFELDVLPSSIVFIGGGAIGMEFSHIFARAGSKVTILEAAPRILSAMDEDVVKELASFSKSLGIDIYTGVRIESIEKVSPGMAVTFSCQNGLKTVKADIVANGSGRIADIDTLDLEKAGISIDDKGILLDSYLRSTTNPDVFVAGDAVRQSPQLSPVAIYEGRIVAHNLTSDDLISPDYNPFPYVIYTIPELAGVGLTEYEATVKGMQFITVFHDLKPLMITTIYAEPAAFSKVLIDRDNNRILGAHILGHKAQELINIFALAIEYGITSYDLHRFLFAFPTFSSDISDMVRIKSEQAREKLGLHP